MAMALTQINGRPRHRSEAEFPCAGPPFIQPLVVRLRKMRLQPPQFAVLDTRKLANRTAARLCSRPRGTLIDNTIYVKPRDTPLVSAQSGLFSQQ